MSRLMLVLVLVLVVAAPAAAEQPGSEKGRVESVFATPTTTPGYELPCNGTNAIEIAGGGADVTCIAMPVGRTEQHSVFYRASAASTAAIIDLTWQSLTPAGQWVAFSPAVTQQLTGATTYSGRVAVTFPVCDTVRVVVSGDATHATTMTELGLSKW